MRRKGLIIKHIAIVVVICLLMGLTAYVLRRNDGYEKNREFYTTDENYDVLFFGSSHAVMGVLPMELWHDYGITSYNLANNGQMLPIDYWVLKDALDRQEPELVVIDVYTLYADEKYAVMEYAHGSLDPMPMSMTKIQAIMDIFPEENWQEFMIPFSLYHNRWDTMSSEFFDREASTQKGAYENNAEGTPFVEPVIKINMTVPEYTEMPETTNKTYLRKMIELCQEAGIPVLLTAAPFNDGEYLAEWTNGARELAQEYDVPFLNGLEADIINTNCDLYDRGHLNSSGARKWTEYLGSYIASNYGIADKRTDANYSDWNTDYEEYRAYKVEEINTVGDIYPLLMLLNDDEWSACVSIKQGSTAFRDNWFWELLYNAAPVTKTGDNSQNYFCIIDNGAGTVTERFGAMEPENIATSFGTVMYSLDASGLAQVTLAEKPEETQAQIASQQQVNLALTEGEESSTHLGVQIWVFNHETGEVIRYASF